MKKPTILWQNKREYPNMKQIKITRQDATFTLTGRELDAAYLFMERYYLEEDIINIIIDEYDNCNIRFSYQHIREFPELLDWLCGCYNAFFDANMSYNDTIELLINHLSNESQTPEFFRYLAGYAKSICLDCPGDPMDTKACEDACSRYCRPKALNMPADRVKQYEALSTLLTMHKHNNCSCKPKEEEPCLCHAAKYLCGIWDIKEFFCSQNNQEVA